MALFSNTRIVLRHLTSRLCNDLITGTVTSPASGTFVCAETDWEKGDDYFNKYVEMFCYAGTGVGTSGNPSDWVNNTHTLTFLPAATLTAADSVEMHRTFTVNEYNSYINLAIDMVAKEALLNRVDTGVTLAADTYQYTLSTQFLYVTKIELESGTDGVYNLDNPIGPRYWRIIRASTITLEFVKNHWSPTADRNLRITGFASPSKLDTDTEACPINPAFITYQAAALLHQSRIRGTDADSEYHRGQMTLAQAMADKVRPTLRVSVGGAIPVIEA